MASLANWLKQREKRRWLHDRLARGLVKLGGICVLLTLALLIIYLLRVVLPIFSSASITSKFQSDAPLVSEITEQAVELGVADDGQFAYSLTSDGQLNWWQLGSPAHLFHQVSLAQQVSSFAASTSSSRWYAYATQDGQVVPFQVQFPTKSLIRALQTNRLTDNGSLGVQHFTPQALQLDPNHGAIRQFTFGISEQDALFIGQNQHGQWLSLAFHKPSSFVKQNEAWQPQELHLPPLPARVQQLQLTPDGKTLYLLLDNELWVVKRQQDRMWVREKIALTQGESKHKVEKFYLLSGANSLLLQHQDKLVSQWFDVLQDGQRHLTHIRDFNLRDKAASLLPDYYRKGFYSFEQGGWLQSHYTTSERINLSQKVFQQAPLMAATSANETYLLVINQASWQLLQVNNPYPEISWSALWNKVWYQGYPEPDYIWQSTSASNDFESKFSLMPIAFGTIKSALFAMLFAVPIAIFGAIYTAYFMTPRMRRYVKPSIELMEALPTVIIGFLAGLWLAPLIEQHLFITLCLFLFMPLFIVLVALLWQCLPIQMRPKQQQAWLGLLLIPLLLVFTASVIHFSADIEHGLFAGDIRFYLAELGIDFEQRNALVVGFAMGFAVIPTVFTIAEDAIFSVPKHLSDGASALGATSWQCLTSVVLVTASPGIFSAVMMGLGRAVGETMIVLMATGNTPIMNANLLQGMRTLSANIAIEMPESDVGSSHFRLLFLTALLLFLFTFIVNSLAEVIRQRLRDKYSVM